MIKVLFVHSNNSHSLFDNAKQGVCESNDYLTDAIFLEMKMNTEFLIYECPFMSHMYENSLTDIKNITGYGFALRKKIKTPPNILTVSQCLEMISDNFFDYIITDSRTMNEWWYRRGLSPFYHNSTVIKSSILNSYDKSKIIFLDGEDQPDQIQNDFYGKSKYFKRELMINDSNLFPVGYCFPQEQFKEIKNIGDKINSLGSIIPGIRSSYSFSNENDYYNNYNISFFGLTWKKLGWDCFRHHEISFSSCLPIFPDIDECPDLTLTKYPKDICRKILKMDGVNLSNIEKKWIAHDLYYFDNISVDVDKINHSQYIEILNELVEFSFNNTSSKKMVEYIINA